MNNQEQEWLADISVQSLGPLPCPYCGGQGGNHVWAGSGICPGAGGIWHGHQYAVSDTDTEMRILAELAAIREQLRVLGRLMLVLEERSRS
jgi:hypothetical protein